MQTPRRRRHSAAQIIGMTLVVAAYAAALIWAGELAAGAPAVATTATAGTVAEQGTEVVAASMAVVEGAGAEAPLVTLGIAATLTLVGGTAFLIRRVRTRRPVARRTVPVLRHITTIM